MKNGTMYIDVILPLALANSYTYLVPEDMADEVRTGARVIVSFGAKKFYTALVYRIHNEKPELFEPKEIVAVLDEKKFVKNGTRTSVPSIYGSEPLIPTIPPQVRVPITVPALLALKLQGNRSPSEHEYLSINSTFGP